LNFLNLLDHCSFQLQEYKMPGNTPDHVKNSRRITSFVTEYLKKQHGIYLFNLPGDV
jgi:hypothetical protein